MLVYGVIFSICGLVNHTYVFAASKYECNSINAKIIEARVTLFTLKARDKNCMTGVKLKNGEFYTFSIHSISDDWKDGDKNNGLGSYKGLDHTGWDISWLPWYKRWIWLIEGFRQCTTANWFEIVGVVPGEDGNPMQFRIGEGINSKKYLHYKGEDNKELIVYANDLPGYYDNNHGEMKLKIIRVNKDEVNKNSHYLLCL